MEKGKVTITITCDPATGFVDIAGPELLQARSLYDYITAEIGRLTMLKFVERGGKVSSILPATSLPPEFKP